MTNSINKTFIDALPILINRYQDETVNKIATTDNRLCRVVDGNINKRQANNSAGVVMYDSTGNLANLLVYPSDTQGNEKRPFLMSSYQGEAIVLGDLAGEKIAVLGIDNALSLYDSMITDRKNPCILTLPDNMESCFNIMLQAFKPSKVYSTHDKPIKDFWGDCILTIAPLSIALQSDSLAVVLADDDTKVINGWGEVLPLVPSTSNKAFPIHRLSPQLRNVVERLAYYAQVPISWAVNSVLGVLSVIGQRAVNAPMQYGQFKPTSLFLLTQAKSGAGKTTLQEFAYLAIKNYTEQQDTKFIKDRLNWENTYLATDPKDRGQWQSENPKPINPQMLLSDTTIEPLLDRYILDDMRNLAIISSEAGKLFGGYSLKADTQDNALSHLTTLYDGGRAERLRSQRGKYAEFKTMACGVRLSIEVSGQQVILQSIIENEKMNGQGLLPRFLLTCEDDILGDRKWNDPERMNLVASDDEVFQGFWARCLYLLENPIDKALYEFTQVPQSAYDNVGRYNMPFAKGALQTFANFQQSLEVLYKTDLKEWTAYASRMPENASRIATLLAYYDGKHELTQDYLDTAFEFVWFYMRERMNYGQAQEISDLQKLLDKIIQLAKAKGGSITKRELQQKAPMPYRKSVALLNALDELAQKNCIKFDENDNKIPIVVNPSLL